MPFPAFTRACIHRKLACVARSFGLFNPEDSLPARGQMQPVVGTEAAIKQESTTQVFDWP
jgi:hypothetical protein